MDEAPLYYTIAAIAPVMPTSMYRSGATTFGNIENLWKHVLHPSFLVQTGVQSETGSQGYLAHKKQHPPRTLLPRALW